VSQPRRLRCFTSDIPAKRLTAF